MAVSPRQIVAPPAPTPLGYGLLDSGLFASPEEVAAEHWKLGVQTQPGYCGPAGSLVGTCTTGIGVTKTALPNDMTIRGADPFTVYAWINCGPVGAPEQWQRDTAIRALTQGEQFAVERVFWTGAPTLGGTVRPHLAHLAAAVFEGGGLEQRVLLQPQASVVTTGTAVDVTEAIGLLEEAMGGCYGGTPTLHVPRAAIAHLSANDLIRSTGQQLRTMADSLVIAGVGYPRTGPDGAAPPPGQGWFFATGTPKIWRETNPRLVSNFGEAVNRSINDLVLIAERTYVIIWDCCLFAAQVSLGGTITGTQQAPS